jgi:uncharacterized membrane protein
MTPPRETVLFEAISTPPQSFSARGFRVLAGLLILAAAIPACIFFALGAWPVLPFIGLEVGAALAALLWHARASRRISEMVLLTDAGLSIRHVDHRGRVVRSVLDAYWAKVELDEAAPRAGKLLLKSRGRVLEIGRHLAAPEKAELAEALRGALARARRPDFDNPQLREL